MGQKIHPLGFRLGVNQNHRSIWFIGTDLYSQVIKEDRKIRNCIQKYVRKNIKNTSNYGGIARIEIKRKTDLINITIHTGFPDLLMEERGSGMEQLKSTIQKDLIYKRNKLHISLIELEKPYREPKILAEHIASQLENRVAFRRTMKKAIELFEKTNNNGIKIQISGRLNGNEIARSEWVREGRIPLQTLRASINYSYYPAQTIYGVLGIKVWIFQNNN